MTGEPPTRSALSDIIARRSSLLLLLFPVTLGVALLAPEQQIWIFFLSAATLVPLAHLLSLATEEFSFHTGPTMGALLNVTFGNAGELLVGFFALRQGLDRVVKASITGSILSNLLLALGVSVLVAGIKKKTLSFNPLAARTRATLLALAGLSLVLPAAYHYAAHSENASREHDLSFAFSFILLVTYACALLFTLHTHSQLLAPRQQESSTGRPWSKAASLVVLLLSSCAIGLVSEILSGSIETASKRLGLSDLFVGVILLALFGNAAETLSAIRAALAGRMDLSVGITLGSSTQVALFVAPALVIASRWTGHRPMDLLFTPIEITTLVLAIAITGQIAGDGDSNWFEGVQLLAVYLMLAVIFFLMPS